MFTLLRTLGVMLLMIVVAWSLATDDQRRRLLVADADAEIVDVGGDARVGRFSAEYAFDGLIPPLGFQQQLEIDLDGVFHFLADDLGLHGVQPVHQRLRIIDGSARFARLAASTGLLNQLAANRCRPFDHVAYLERDYFGGLDSLHRDWRRWPAGEAAPLHF